MSEDFYVIEEGLQFVAQPYPFKLREASKHTILLHHKSYMRHRLFLWRKSTSVVLQYQNNNTSIRQMFKGTVHPKLKILWTLRNFTVFFFFSIQWKSIVTKVIKILYFMFHRKKKVTQVLNNMRAHKWWRNLNFLVNFMTALSPSRSLCQPVVCWSVSANPNVPGSPAFQQISYKY